MAKRGRPPTFVRDAEGREVHGLSAQPVKNKKGEITAYRYYPTFKTPRVWIGTYATRSDPVGIMEFRAWESQQKRDTVRVTQTDKVVAWGGKKTTTWTRIAKNSAANRYVDHETSFEINSDAFWAFVRDAILSDPHMVAQRTGIPAIARLDKIPKPKPSLPLTDAGDLYSETKDDCDKEGMASVRKWWAEFVTIVGALNPPVRAVDELTHEAFLAYAKRIKADEKKVSERTHKPRTTSYRRSRFSAVTTILNYAYACRRLSDEQITRLQADWKVPLKRPPARKGKKIIITPAEFKAMLDKAHDYDRAMLLMGVNCCFYPVDFAVQWEHVNLDESTLVFRREKKNERGIEGTTRVAVLWKTTVAALRRLHEHRTTPYIFATSGGIPPHRKEVLRRVQKLARYAELTSGIRAEDLRNTAATIASRNAASMQYKVMMGHTLPGEDAGYIEGNPWYVQDACKAIGDYLGVE